MGLATDAEHPVLGQAQTPCLQVLLQARLGVLEHGCSRQVLEMPLPEALHQAAGGLQATVQIHRPDDGLEGIGKNGIAAETTALQFPGPQVEVFSKPELARNPGQGLAPHQGRAQPAQLALAVFGEAAVEYLGDQHAEHGIAEKLQSFVVAAAGTAVSERPFEQGLILEGVPQGFPEIPRASVQCSRTSTSLLKLVTASTLPRMGTRTS